MISLDTETTGLDLQHGASPYLVTMCDEQGDNTWWEFDVDPYTRKVLYDKPSLVEIQEVVDGADEIVFQNPKFDVLALAVAFKQKRLRFKIDWSKVRDTLLAGHLLRSNQLHDLTTMALVYLNVNVKHFEDGVEKATKQCRSMAQGANPKYKWRIANEDLPEMPSAKKTTWKYDMWLPRYVAGLLGYLEDHWYWTVCSEYANSDSTVTLPLYIEQLSRIRDSNLEAIYRERLKVLPIVYDMEGYGVSLSKPRLRKQRQEYEREAKVASDKCYAIAKRKKYDLKLPKAANNNSLLNFVFGPEGLELPPIERSAKTGTPSLKARVVEEYLLTLEPKSDEAVFLGSLRDKRKRDTAVTFMKSYEKFWIPLDTYNNNGQQLWYRIHPSLNPTGTDTLRWSSSNPNEQNISKKEGFNIREAFGPAPGREWWSMDANNIELRIPAYESGEEELIKLFENSHEPPYYGSVHLLNFSTIYEDIWAKELKSVGINKVGPHCKSKYDSTWYQYCKNGDFAVQYLAGEGTADKAFHRMGSHARLKERFALQEVLNQKWISFATSHGYVETLPDKLVDPERGYPLYCTRTRRGYIKPTIPLNYHVQGTAMWWMMVAMINCQDYLDELNAKPGSEGYHMVAQIHDEIVFDVPKGTGSNPYKTNLPKMRRLRNLMQQGGDRIGIPTPVSISCHPNTWSEGVSV